MRGAFELYYIVCPDIIDVTEKSTVEAYGKDYYYKFRQTLLGDPNFAILVTLSIPEAAAYAEQIAIFTS